MRSESAALVAEIVVIVVLEALAVRETAVADLNVAESVLEVTKVLEGPGTDSRSCAGLTGLPHTQKDER